MLKAGLRTPRRQPDSLGPRRFDRGTRRMDLTLADDEFRSAARRARLVGGTLALACSLALCAARQARADGATGVADSANQDSGDYNRMIEQAVQRFKARDFTGARELFAAAHASHPSARTLRGLGLTDFESGRYALAIGELEAALNDQRKPLDDQQRSEVQAVIAHAQSFVGTLDIELDPSNATLSVDDGEVAAGPLRLDAGSHLLRARAPGYLDAEWRLDLQPGETTRTTLALEPAPAPTPALASEQPPEPYDATQRTAAWIVGGVGVAGVIVGSVFGVLSIVKHNESDKYCEQGGMCSDVRGVEAMDAARAAGDVSTVAFVVGGVALGAATVLLLTAPEEHDGAPMSARIGIGPGGVSLRGVF
jgi:hypothetical protein